LDNEPFQRTIAKLIRKINPTIASELIIFIRGTVLCLINIRKGKELVQVYLERGSVEDREFMIVFILERILELIQDEPSQ